MRKAFTLLAMAGAAASLSACAGGERGRPGMWSPGQELVGRSLRLETQGGQRSTLAFRRGGDVRATFGERETRGRWWAAERRLCFRWPGATTECWPYARPFRRGEPVSVTSDRGNVVRVTLL